MVGEDDVEVVVVVGEAVDRQDQIEQQQAEQHHQRGQQREAGQGDGDEDRGRMVATEPFRDAGGQVARSRLEHRRRRCAGLRRRPACGSQGTHAGGRMQVVVHP